MRIFTVFIRKVRFNTSPNLRFTLAAAQIRQRLQRFGINGRIFFADPRRRSGH
jgi:hypothetical protein